MDLCCTENVIALGLIVGCFGMLSIVESETSPPPGLAAGDVLPVLKGEFLTGRTAILPGAASGRVALLLLGFSYDSRLAVEAWAKRFRARFGKEPKVAFYEIPMIGGMARMGKWFIDSGMRRGTPKADHENVITVYGGTDPWKERLRFKDPKAAHLILLDQSGRVVFLWAGRFDEQAFEELSGHVARLVK